MERQIIVFKIGKEVFGVYVSQVKEIIDMTSISAIPNLPDYVAGVVNIRGKIHVIYKLRKRFNLEDKPDDDDTKIIVTNQKNIGFIVDEVTEIIPVIPEDMERASDIALVMEKKFISDIVKHNDRIIIILDPVKILNDKDIDEVQHLTEMGEKK